MTEAERKARIQFEQEMERRAGIYPVAGLGRVLPVNDVLDLMWWAYRQGWITCFDLKDQESSHERAGV